MSQATVPALAAMGVAMKTAERPSEVAETVDAAAKLAFSTYRPVAVLIAQRVVGAKEFK